MLAAIRAFWPLLPGLPHRLGLLIAVGTSIWAVWAIAATGPAIEAEERQITCAVAVITVFGILATLVYPQAPGLGIRRLYRAATRLLPAARDLGETRDR